MPNNFDLAVEQAQMAAEAYLKMDIWLTELVETAKTLPLAQVTEAIQKACDTEDRAKAFHRIHAMVMSKDSRARRYSRMGDPSD